MKHYVITEKVTLQAGAKEYRKGQTITATDVGQANIDRYLKKGYIKLLGDDLATQPGGGNDNPPGDNLAKQPAGSDGGNGDPPFYMTAEDFLTPEQVDKLTKPQLIEYAGRIGYSGYKPNISAADLKIQINQFIEEATEDDDLEDDESDGDGSPTSEAEDQVT